ncbi:MAG: energy transducer TonB [Crocinitomicaceae bacterium]|nr:energy transducer TonB [Flavobacteriales bacterium]NQZ34093.1 energy transducer TonB [Crocinitomicaceae bacterium]
MLKNTILVICLLFLGTAIAQETELVPPPPPILKENVDNENSISDFPDVEAQFPGGAKAMKVFIQNNVQYPIDAIEKNIQGRVYLSFIVEIDGSLSGIDLMRGGISPSINKEAIRLIRAMPNWIPGEVDGKKVRSRCRLPINFTLSNPSKEEAPEKKH